MTDSSKFKYNMLFRDNIIDLHVVLDLEGLDRLERAIPAIREILETSPDSKGEEEKPASGETG